MRILTFAFLICWIATATAKTKLPEHRGSTKLICKARELKRKNCELKQGKLHIGLFQDKWRFDDGKWLVNLDIPVAGDHVQWEKVVLNNYGQRRTVEMWIWSEPEGEARVQSLHWLVFEIGDFDKEPRLQQVVRRRRELPQRQVASTGTPSRTRFQNDPMEKHSLSLKHGKLQWRVGRQKGEF